MDVVIALEIVIVAILFGVLSLMLFGRRAERRIADAVKESIKVKQRWDDKEDVDKWNGIWRMMCERLGITARSDGTWEGGQASVNLLNLMRRLLFGKIMVP